MQFFTENLSKILDATPKKIAVGLSGGCDSMALTFLLRDFCVLHKIELFAVTIDHKIRQNSSKEARQVSDLMQAHKINHEILTIEENFAANIEANLRQARYDLLLDFCHKNNISHLFLGHHLGDVAENFLIRLFRGSGLDGLSTMADNFNRDGVKILRPLLDISKDKLINYLQEKDIIWFEDETNEDERFLRNKMRKFLDSFDEKDEISVRIKRFSDEIAEIRDEFDEKMLINAKNCLEFNKNGYFLLDLAKFKQINEKIALKILALMLMEISGKKYKPRLEKLRNFYNYIYENEIDEIKRKNFYGCMIKRYDGKKLVLFEEFLDEKLQKEILSKIDFKNENAPKLTTILKKIF